MTGEGDAVECSSICSGTSLPNRSLICCESLHQLAMSNKSCNKQRAVLHDSEGIEAELGQGRILIAVFPLTGPAQREAFQHVYQSALGLLHLAVRLLYFVLASMNSERRERERMLLPCRERRTLKYFVRLRRRSLLVGVTSSLSSLNFSAHRTAALGTSYAGRCSLKIR